MLNTKYLIQPDEEGAATVSLNPEALGNAWFVSGLVKVPDADAEIRALDTLDVARVAVVNASDFPEVQAAAMQADSTASIRLETYRPNYLKYQGQNSEEGLAVFSEMYYPHGWQAYIDGQKAPHFRVNYALRAMKLPAGRHTVEFRFIPQVVETGSKYSLAGAALLALILLGAAGFEWMKGRKREA